MQNTDTLIIGSGLSGLSAAYHLLKQGYDGSIQILEARDVIGGRTSSWMEGDMHVESGLHRFLGFYTELPDLLNDVGVDIDEMLCWEDEIEVLLKDSDANGLFGVSPVRKPLKTIGGLLRNNDFISPGEKLKLAKFFATGLKQLKDDPEALDNKSVLDVAREADMDDETILKVLVPLTDGIWFLQPEEHSAYIIFQIVANAMKHPLKIRVGAYMGGMTDVMMNPIADYLKAKNVTIQTGRKVDSIEQSTDGWRVVSGDITVQTKNVVVATSLVPAQKLLQRCLPDEPFMKLGSNPAVTLQIEFDKPTYHIDRTEFGPGSVLASFAEQSRTTFRHAGGRLSMIFTQPKEHLEMSPEELLQKVLSDGESLGLEFGNVSKYRKVAHQHDFYMQSPGMNKLRPEQKTPLTGLYLAGDYTQQHYFSTMEGAVISGRLAAEAILSD